MTDEELAALVEAYHDGVLDIAAAERIAASLAAGDVDGEAFAAHHAFAGLLAQARDGADGEAVVAGLRERLRAEASPSRFLQAVRRRRGRGARRTAYAAALAASLLLACWLVARGPGGETVTITDGEVAAAGGTGFAAGARGGAGDTIRALATPARLRFADGTMLILDPGSAATLEAGEGKRLRLTGRCTAEVAPQPADRPLVIAAGGATATVVGTRFALATTPDGARLEVVDGSVVLAAGDVAETVGAGEAAIAVDAGDPVDGGARIHRFPATARDPRAFGAIADDADNDAGAFQAALDAAGRGGTVLVPPGRWRLARPLRLSAGARLIGENRARCILAPTLDAIDALVGMTAADGVEVRELGFDGERRLREPAVMVYGGRDIRLRWLAVRDLADDTDVAAIWLVGEQGVASYAGGVADATIADCVIERIGLASPWSAGIRIGWGCHDIVVERNRVAGAGRGGIVANDGVRRLVVQGNRIAGIGRGADVRLGIEVWKDCDDAVIADNDVEHRISVVGCARVAVRGNRIGAGASDRGDLALFLNGVDLLVRDNVVDGGHECGVLRDGDGNRRLWLTRNRISGVPGIAVALSAGDGALAVGNRIEGCGPVAARPQDILANLVDGVADPAFTGAPLELTAPSTATVGAATSLALRFADGRTMAHALWDVGVGPPLVGERISHVFASAGPYRVSVVAWDAAGRVGMGSAVIDAAP
ncbi:MAG TPA: FecR domain-containing protein [Planctomycetota bacterium]|nr:FecR domain-containing protein [Planctomycetota bacterium]